MDEPEIQHASPEARRHALALVLILAALGAAGLWLVERSLDRAFDMATGKADLAAARTTVLAVGVGLGLGLLAVGVWMIALGRRIGAAGRYPTPSMKVIHDTPVRRGPAAVRMARILYAGALVLGLGGIAIPLALWRLLASLAAP